jgi:hypothetical protein
MARIGEVRLGRAGTARRGQAGTARQGLYRLGTARIGRLVAQDLRQRKEDEMNAGHHQVEARHDDGR